MAAQGAIVEGCNDLLLEGWIVTHPDSVVDTEDAIEEGISWVRRRRDGQGLKKF
jgi:hypothetical protein